MKIETKLIVYLSACFFFFAVVYGIFTHIYSIGGVEWAGETAFIMTGLLGTLMGGYFWFVSRRLSKPRPEDDEEGTIEDNPEELGFFSPGSIWPIMLAFMVAVVGLSVAMDYLWMLVPAAFFLILTVAGLTFEYHKPPEKH